MCSICATVYNMHYIKFIRFMFSFIFGVFFASYFPSKFVAWWLLLYFTEYNFFMCLYCLFRSMFSTHSHVHWLLDRLQKKIKIFLVEILSATAIVCCWCGNYSHICVNSNIVFSIFFSFKSLLSLRLLIATVVLIV